MKVEISKIKVNDRIRKDLGNLQELADDIRENGLINPPVVTPDDYVLIAGERRLEAMKLLGYKETEVRVMTIKDAEHQLNLEISENETRKDFSKAERIEYARRLEKIESLKAHQRKLHTQNNNTSRADRETFPTLVAQGRAREVVSVKLGIGSGRQYEKEKYICDNKDSLTPEDFADWDEGRLSTNKVYQMLKNQNNSLQKNLQDYKTDYQRLQSEFKDKVSELQDLRKQIEAINNESPQTQNRNRLQDSALLFCARIDKFIEQVGGYVWLTEKINEIPELERQAYIKSVHAIKAWADTMEFNMNNNTKEIN